MFKKIYVPVDNSEYSNRAVEIAITLAKQFDAALVGSHVYAARLHDYRFRQMEYTLPEEYLEENELERQRKIHNSLIAMGLKLISDSYLDVMERRCQEERIPFERKTFDGKHYKVLMEDIKGSDYDLVIIGALGIGAVKDSLIGSVCERVVRRVTTDAFVVKSLETNGDGQAILVGVDGSPQSFAGLKVGMALGKALGRPVEAVAVYDPYLHYSVFSGIVKVLSEQASKVFRFKEQEKLHEEIIDTGLAKIYQSHLEIARKVAVEEGVDLKITLLDGKAFEKILQYVRKTRPWLLILGRIGVHSDETEMDLGSNVENLLRLAPCHVYLSGRKFYPSMDVKAEEIMFWTEEAKQRMERVPQQVRGIARTAILRFAIEQGHTVISSKVIDQAMELFMPGAAARKVQEVAKELALQTLKTQDEVTAICAVCGYVAKGQDPVKCPVCGAGAERFQVIDQTVIEAVARQEGGIQEEEAFDGAKLRWTEEARKVLKEITDAYLRRRAKARIEKSARVKRLSTITKEFALPIIQDTVGDSGFREADGTIEVEARDTGNQALQWTEEAMARLMRVPVGFMRETTRSRIEALAAEKGEKIITLSLCEQGIGQSRDMMNEVIAEYVRDKKPYGTGESS
ncbi:MAG: universal stress protein [candidate division NC10 bacterium]|nr:universal stress protein [candidate division NC10 bacterium]